MLIFWLIVYGLELTLVLTPLWAARRLAVYPLIILIVLSGILLGVNSFAPVQIAIALLSVFRVVNLLRIIKNRMHAQYLWRAVRRTTLVIAGYHGLALYGYILFINFLDTSQTMRYVALTQFIAAVLILGFTLKNVISTRPKHKKTHLSQLHLPTVSVVIPARNETQDLEECLHSVLRSAYSRLEVIVLDDCSQAPTADIIKSFAHAGVRFVPGDEPAQRWLAKNQAYHKLLTEATGDIVLFIGVDVRLDKHAITEMVAFMKSRNKKMISVLPQRALDRPDAALIQPMRYWWELALPRKLFNRPPVLSTFWAADRSELIKLGGFSSVSHAILPEGFFAREFIKTNSYSFLHSNPKLSVFTVKSLANQRSTALRTRYPMLRRRMEWALPLGVAEFVLLFAPPVVLAWAIWQRDFTTALLAGAALGSLLAAHLIIMFITDRHNLIRALVNFPLVVLNEIGIGYFSMFKYEFGVIEWKDRNVCLPVMHVYPRLPELEPTSSSG